MRREEWERKVTELQLDHIAGRGFISKEEAEKVIEQVYGLKPPEDTDCLPSDKR